MKQQIPADARFVSLGPAHHLFLFHLQEPVRRLGTDEIEPAAWGNAEYFCMWIKGTDPPQLGFSWEPVATISCDRNRSGASDGSDDRRTPHVRSRSGRTVATVA